MENSTEHVITGTTYVVDHDNKQIYTKQTHVMSEDGVMIPKVKLTHTNGSYEQFQKALALYNPELSLEERAGDLGFTKQQVLDLLEKAKQPVVSLVKKS